MKIFSKNIRSLGSSSFGSSKFGGKLLNSAGVKKELTKIAYGGKSLGSINKKLKEAGVSESVRKKYLEVIESKFGFSKNEISSKQKEGKSGYNIVHRQEELSSKNSGSRYRFGGNTTTSASVLGGVGGGVKGNSQNLGLIKKSDSQNFGRQGGVR